ncbi:hypothetical protein [Allosphingosinicella sp.]|jgi:hypothetical protein|uniref:hypothetical protein n=1 Tax=Allosphingosinicella sp. TaxID=2823234 RepID=UPI003D7201AB
MELEAFCKASDEWIRLAYQGVSMSRVRISSIPDDIKIIAQFLANYSTPRREWQDLTRDAFKLRQELKRRGEFKPISG